MPLRVAPRPRRDRLAPRCMTLMCAACNGYGPIFTVGTGQGPRTNISGIFDNRNVGFITLIRTWARATRSCQVASHKKGQVVSEKLPTRNRRFFDHHTHIFQMIRPLAVGPSVAELEMLSKVVDSVEFLAAIALLEFVDVLEMPNTLLPILFGRRYRRRWVRRSPTAREIFTAEATAISLAGACRALVKGAVIAGQC